jgi:2-polyprenyl-3-methyl-5-hydroxy-6-metoxy-1,4-benzoquinol methylase
MLNKQWDEVYSKKAMAAYPDNMLVRFVAKHYYKAPNRKEVKFLDVGCGVGASTWYLAREGFSVAAIDGSLQAINRLKQRLAADKLDVLLACGDITELEFKENYFDCIVDVSALCYIPEDEIKKVMTNLHKVLKPGGRLFSICPTNFCARKPYNHTIDGVELKCSFLEHEEMMRRYSNFKIYTKTCKYEVDEEQNIDLWVVEAVK